jgi:hypothetical protein
MSYSGILRRVALVITDVSEEHIFVDFPTSLILVNLVTEAPHGVTT